MKPSETYMPDAGTANEVLNPELQADIEKLARLQNSSERVKVFARIMDDYGVEAVAGLVEGYGDVATSAISGIYLLGETMYSGGNTLDYLKVVGYQALDLAVGAIPVAGDVADFFLKANKMTSNDFQKRTLQLQTKIMEKMRADGMSDEQIKESMAQIQKSAKELPQLIDHVVTVAGAQERT
jgi:hypothetical protein